MTHEHTKKIILECRSDSPVQWYRKNTNQVLKWPKYTEFSRAVGKYLVLRNLKISDSTWYYCKGKHAGRQFFEGSEILVGGKCY